MSHDAEPLQPMTPSEEDFVRELGRVMTALPRVVDADMAHECGLSLAEYTPLMYLSEVPERQMRMSELASVCGLSLGGMTRVVNRLEREGWVRRIRCVSDGRGWNAFLTDQGLARLRQAWPTHLASVRRHLLDHVGEDVIENFTTALRHVASRSGRGA